jgi:hypothetical protein
MVSCKRRPLTVSLTRGSGTFSALSGKYFSWLTNKLLF